MSINGFAKGREVSASPLADDRSDPVLAGKFRTHLESSKSSVITGRSVYALLYLKPGAAPICSSSWILAVGVHSLLMPQVHFTIDSRMLDEFWVLI